MVFPKASFIVLHTNYSFLFCFHTRNDIFLIVCNNLDATIQDNLDATISRQLLYSHYV